MPTTAYLQVPVQILKKDDVISTANDCEWAYGAVVGTVAVGTKWVVIRDTNGHLIRRVEKDTQVRIERQVPTAEEAWEDQKAQMRRRLAIWEKSVTEEYDKALRYLTERVMAPAVIVSAAALYEKYEAARVRTVFMAEANRYAQKKFDGDIIEGYLHTCYMKRYELLKGMMDPTSRTLSMHDACTWIEHSTIRSILNEMEYVIKFDGLEKPE